MDYPTIKDPDFYNKINKKFKRYEIPKKKPSRRELCYPEKYKLQIPQKFLAEYLGPKSPYKGVLMFHRIGAGKTCTAIQIAEKWKHMAKIIAVVPASVKGSFRAELRSLCAKNEYITPLKRKLLQTLDPTDEKYKKIIAESNAKIDKVYQIFSYNKFVEKAEEGSLVLRNRILIIDEIQNMVSEHGKFYWSLYEAIKAAPSSLRIVLLSATPMFDKPVEVALTMNLLRLPVELPIGREFETMFVKHRKVSNGKIMYKAQNLDLFKQMIKGYVSYYSGAPPKAFPDKIVKYVKCKMEPFQYKSYLTVVSDEDVASDGSRLKSVKKKIFKEGGIIELPNNFFIGSRIISNVAFPNKGINEDGFVSFQGKYVKPPLLQQYSQKFYRMMRKIKRCQGTVFVYSNFKEYGGIKSFAKVLEGQGYKEYATHKSGRKRYALWSGDESTEQKDEIREIFNHKKNSKGEKLKILLGSPSIKEGVSLLRVQEVHIIEPYWNQSRVDQVIGRAIRFCSHKDMPLDKRLVKVYIYIAVSPKGDETIDQYIQFLSKRKNRVVKEFEHALKEASIDCNLNKHSNSHTGEMKIVCDG
jgi:hypothetical protein